MGKLLTESVRETLQAQYPNEDLVEIDGYIYHLPRTEEAWMLLRDRVRPGWGIMKEDTGLKHYIIYNPIYYMAVKYMKNNVVQHRNSTTENIELPINCSSCCNMFKSSLFLDGFEFPKTFDTSEIVDMEAMFEQSEFLGNVSLGDSFKTNKVMRFGGMFSEALIGGTLDLGRNFTLEHALDLSGMFFQSNIKKPIKFGDKFNPENTLRLDGMFMETIMPEGFNIGNNFYIRKGAVVRELFKYAKINNDFWLPECFNIDEDNQGYEGIFECAKLPKRVINIDNDDISEIIAGLKVRDNNVAIDYLEGVL